ncbi:MAG: SiaB family protein kinase [Bacteroidota bacterium]
MIQYQNIHDNNIILMYKGILTFDLLSAIIGSVERRITEFETERRIQKKFYSILTECIQNVYYHLEEAEVKDASIDSESVLILISAKPKYYSIKTCNNIPVANVKSLSDKIDQINGVTKEELKELYREVLSNEEFSSKNTAGIGLMEIARKTDYKLEYNFEKINDEYSYFNFEIRLGRGGEEENNIDKMSESPKVQESLA